MTTVKTAPRHRRACRPRTPFSDLAESIKPSRLVGSPRGFAAASVTGLALTVAVTSAASAAGPQSQSVQTIKTASRASTQASTVKAVDGIAYADGIKTSATAKAPKASPAPQPRRTQTQAQTTNATATRGAAAATTVRATPAVSRSQTRAAAPAATSSASGVVSIAKQYLGVPYVSGGASPAGFDCSGLVQYVFAQAGISLPRTANEQGQSGTVVPASEAQPGDLVWHSYGHIGIYAGGGLVIEATKPGDVVKIQPLWGSYVFVRV